MGYPTQFSTTGKLTKMIWNIILPYFMMKLILNWSKIEFKYQYEPIFFPSTIQVPLHGKFKTRKLLACLDPQYRIVIQCQNIVYVLNGHEIVQPKLRVLKGLTDRTE